MPTPDASQFTQLRKYNAIDSRAGTSISNKQITHLYQPLPSVLYPVDFLPSFTNQYAYPLTYQRLFVDGHGTPTTKIYSPVGQGITSLKYLR